MARLAPAYAVIARLSGHRMRAVNPARADCPLSFFYKKNNGQRLLVFSRQLQLSLKILV
jgi:hypothetical protein